MPVISLPTAGLQISPLIASHGYHPAPRFRSRQPHGAPQKLMSVKRHKTVAQAEGPGERQLVNSVKQVRTVCWISFWSQLALSLTSAGILVFTVLSTQSRAQSSVFLLVGVSTALISTGIVRKILEDARSVINGPDPASAFSKWRAVGWVLRNTDVNLIGMASSIVALQGECGMLVAKMLRTASTVTPYAATTAQGAPASIDVFAVQGCANVLLSHFVSLFFLTFALRSLQRLSPRPAVPS